MFRTVDDQLRFAYWWMIMIAMMMMMHGCIDDEGIDHPLSIVVIP